MGTYCTSHVADLFVFCYKRDFMLSLSVSNEEDVLKLLTVPPDILMTYLILIILTFSKWYVRYIPKFHFNKATSFDTGWTWP